MRSGDQHIYATKANQRWKNSLEIYLLTIDKFSFYNIGMGLSAHIKNFNIYATADNLVALTSIRNSNYQSVQFGMNFIF